MINHHLKGTRSKQGVCREEVEWLFQQTIRKDNHWSRLSAADLRTTSMLCLPSFMFPGFPKTGSTTLHNFLSQHPGISKPMYKEVHWWPRVPMQSYSFSADSAKTAALTYATNFHPLVEKHNATKLLTYDASQTTLVRSNFLEDGHIQDFCAMPALLLQILPRSRFIILMRNPIDRMYSHYLYECTQYQPPKNPRWPFASQKKSSTCFPWESSSHHCWLQVVPTLTYRLWMCK